jgi:hypothetical protein
LPTDNVQGFWRKIWKEAEPIIAHAVIILVLESLLLLIGLGHVGSGALISKAGGLLLDVGESGYLDVSSVALHVRVVHHRASERQAYRRSAGRNANEVIGQ